MYGFRFAFTIASWDPSVTTHASISENSGSNNVAVGDLVVAACPYSIAGDTTVTLTDNLGNTYTEITAAKFFNSADANRATRFFYSVITVAGSCTLTATYGTAAAVVGILAAAYSGISAFQTQGTPKRTAGVGTGTDALASNSATVTAQPALLVGFSYDFSQANGSRTNAGTGATQEVRVQKAGNLADACTLTDKRITATGGATATFTMSQAGDDCEAVALVFTESVTGGGGLSFGPGVSPRKMTMFMDSLRSTVLPPAPLGPLPSFGPGISPRKFTMFYDSPRSTVTGGSVFTRSLEDDLVIGEGTIRYAMRAQLQGDSTVVSDNFPAWTRRVATVTDALTVGDAIVYWRRLLRLLEDDLAIAEGAVSYLQRVRSQSDTVIVSDGLSNWTRRVALASDVLTVADAALTYSIRMRLLEDDLALADALISIRQRVRALADSLTLFDERVSTFFPGALQSLGLTRVGAEDVVRLGSRQETFLGVRDDNKLGSSQEIGLGSASDIQLGGS